MILASSFFPPKSMNRAFPILRFGPADPAMVCFPSPWRNANQTMNRSNVPTAQPNRMLKKSASGVLASLRGSTYRPAYASPLHSLRPCWTAILSILIAVTGFCILIDKGSDFQCLFQQAISRISL